MIDKFEGKYLFLSNFYSSDIVFNGEVFPTVEHAFQAAKCEDAIAYQRIRKAKTPAAAKKLGRKIKLRPYWDNVKFDIMMILVSKKFEDPLLREKLLATGKHELVEGNTWGDIYWGVCKGVGDNHLGKILMSLRKSYGSSRN